MFKTIKGKLLVVLLSFVFITIVTSIIAFNYFVVNKDSLGDIAQKTESVHVLLLQDIKIIHDFFENETINPAFFYTGKSTLIKAHNNICGEIKKELHQLDILQSKNNFLLNDSITNLEMNFSVYSEMVDNIISQIIKRGFKDYGIEGKMRRYAHLLESRSKEIGMINLLQLRRHEKDFIIRQEDIYINKHEKLVSEIRNNINADRSIDDGRKNELLLLLNNYANEFRMLVVFEKKLGLRNYGGLKRSIDERAGSIEFSLSSLVQISKEKANAAIIRMEILYLVIGLVFILISIISAVVISRRILFVVSDLKTKITQFVESDFTQRTVLPINNSVNEIDVLITNVSIMEQHIVDQMAILKQTNKDLEMLFYATSQDIRSPLIMVKRLVEVAETKTNDEQALMYFGMIRESWDNLHNIIDELGLITNIRNVEIKTEVIQLEPLIKTVFSEFRSLESFDNIIFSLELKTQNEFYSSPGLIRTIFRNLIENSIKYATKRPVFSFVKISVVDQNDEMLRIEISDNGIGIKKEHHEKIYDMFFRANSYTSGTGLGLYIVKCSLDKLNGAISVESDENTGTTFTLILPKNSRAKNMKEKIMQKIEIFSLNDVLPS